MGCEGTCSSGNPFTQMLVSCCVHTLNPKPYTLHPALKSSSLAVAWARWSQMRAACKGLLWCSSSAGQPCAVHEPGVHVV